MAAEPLDLRIHHENRFHHPAILMRRLSLLPTLLLSLALTFSLTACDSNDDGDDNGGGGGGGGGNVGSYSATLGGDLSGSLSGNAFFSVIEDADVPGERAFVLYLFDGDITDAGTTGEFIAFVRYGDRPGTGSYPLGPDPETEDNEFVGTYYDLQSQTSAVFIVSEDGAFNVTSSSSGNLEGTFNFSGTGFDTSNPQDPQEVNGTVQGSFDAVFIDPGEGPGLPTGGF